MNCQVCVASSRMNEIGRRCCDWARQNLPAGFDLTDNLQECEVFISVLYDTLIPKSFIDRRRCYNFHPGLLPNYRGSGVYSWVLINSEVETGVTLHEIDYNIDSGPIIATRNTEIGEYDTAETLFVRCMDLLFDLFTSYFLRLLHNDYKTRPNQGGRLYLRRQLEQAKDLSKIVRAFTFSGKESAYWVDSLGQKHDIIWS